MYRGRRGSLADFIKSESQKRQSLTVNTLNETEEIAAIKEKSDVEAISGTKKGDQSLNKSNRGRNKRRNSEDDNSNKKGKFYNAVEVIRFRMQKANELRLQLAEAKARKEANVETSEPDALNTASVDPNSGKDEAMKTDTKDKMEVRHSDHDIKKKDKAKTNNSNENFNDEISDGKINEKYIQPKDEFHPHVRQDNEKDNKGNSNATTYALILSDKSAGSIDTNTCEKQAKTIEDYTSATRIEQRTLTICHKEDNARKTIRPSGRSPSTAHDSLYDDVSLWSSRDEEMGPSDCYKSRGADDMKESREFLKSISNWKNSKDLQKQVQQNRSQSDQRRLEIWFKTKEGRYVRRSKRSVSARMRARKAKVPGKRNSVSVFNYLGDDEESRSIASSVKGNESLAEPQAKESKQTFSGDKSSDNEERVKAKREIDTENKFSSGQIESTNGDDTISVEEVEHINTLGRLGSTLTDEVVHNTLENIETLNQEDEISNNTVEGNGPNSKETNNTENIVGCNGKEENAIEEVASFQTKQNGTVANLKGADEMGIMTEISSTEKGPSDWKYELGNNKSTAKASQREKNQCNEGVGHQKGIYTEHKLILGQSESTETDVGDDTVSVEEVEHINTLGRLGSTLTDEVVQHTLQNIETFNQEDEINDRPLKDIATNSMETDSTEEELRRPGITETANEEVASLQTKQKVNASVANDANDVNDVVGESTEMHSEQKRTGGQTTMEEPQQITEGPTADEHERTEVDARKNPDEKEFISNVNKTACAQPILNVNKTDVAKEGNPEENRYVSSKENDTGQKDANIEKDRSNMEDIEEKITRNYYHGKDLDTNNEILSSSGEIQRAKQTHPETKRNNDCLSETYEQSEVQNNSEEQNTGNEKMKAEFVQTKSEESNSEDVSPIKDVGRETNAISERRDECKEETAAKEEFKEEESKEPRQEQTMNSCPDSTEGQTGDDSRLTVIQTDSTCKGDTNDDKQGSDAESKSATRITEEEKHRDKENYENIVVSKHELVNSDKSRPSDEIVDARLSHQTLQTIHIQKEGVKPKSEISDSDNVKELEKNAKTTQNTQNNPNPKHEKDHKDKSKVSTAKTSESSNVKTDDNEMQKARKRDIGSERSKAMQRTSPNTEKRSLESRSPSESQSEDRKGNSAKSETIPGGSRRTPVKSSKKMAELGRESTRSSGHSADMRWRSSKSPEKLGDMNMKPQKSLRKSAETRRKSLTSPEKSAKMRRKSIFSSEHTAETNELETLRSAERSATTRRKAVLLQDKSLEPRRDSLKSSENSMEGERRGSLKSAGRSEEIRKKYSTIHEDGAKGTRKRSIVEETSDILYKLKSIDKQLAKLQSYDELDPVIEGDLREVPRLKDLARNIASKNNQTENQESVSACRDDSEEGADSIEITVRNDSTNSVKDSSVSHSPGNNLEVVIRIPNGVKASKTGPDLKNDSKEIARSKKNSIEINSADNNVRIMINKNRDVIVHGSQADTVLDLKDRSFTRLKHKSLVKEEDDPDVLYFIKHAKAEHRARVDKIMQELYFLQTDESFLEQKLSNRPWKSVEYKPTMERSIRMYGDRQNFLYSKSNESIQSFSKFATLSQEVKNFLGYNDRSRRQSQSQRVPREVSIATKSQTSPRGLFIPTKTKKERAYNELKKNLKHLY